VTAEKIDFYQEVQIKDDAKTLEYRGQKGAIIGISEEAGVLYGYAVHIHGMDYLIYFDKNEVFPTGIKFSREDYY